MDLVPHVDCRPPTVHGVTRSPVDLEVVIPAFDEEDRLGATLRRIGDALSAQRRTHRIVVVDNGSTDRTTEVADMWTRRLPVQVIGCSRPGEGAAVHRGFLTSPARWVGYCDADGAGLAGLLAPTVDLLATGHRVVVATRYNARDGRPMLERLRGRRPVGFMFFDTGLARRLVARSQLTGPAFDRELLALAYGAGVPVAELPVDWPDRHGSTLRTVADRLRLCRELLALRLLGTEPVDALTLHPDLLSGGGPAGTSGAPESLDGDRPPGPTTAEVHDDSEAHSGAQLA